MPTGVGTALAIAGGAALIGGIAGSQKSKSEQTQSSGVTLDNAGSLENQGKNAAQQGLGDYTNMVNAGPGESDVTAAGGSSRDLASMLQQYSQNGAQPTDGDISNGNSIASKMFGAQRTQLGQNFQDQQYNANQNAALMGRSQDDPILRNKLAQEQTRQTNMLDANQGAYAQQYAMQQPFQRLQFAGQRNDVLGGLASQAMANRQSLASMGSGIMGQGQNFRLATAQHYGTQSQSSGGGLGGALQGGLAGFGAGASMAGGFGGMGGASGAGLGGMGSPGTPFNFGGSNTGSFGGMNPYGAGGDGLSMPSPTPSFSGGNYNFGNASGFGQARTFNLGGN